MQNLKRFKIIQVRVGVTTSHLYPLESLLYKYGKFFTKDPECFLRDTGLNITADRSPVKMTGQLDFSSVKICI